jgi:hypothetical protein
LNFSKGLQVLRKRSLSDSRAKSRARDAEIHGWESGLNRRQMEAQSQVHPLLPVRMQTDPTLRIFLTPCTEP